MKSSQIFATIATTTTLSLMATSAAQAFTIGGHLTETEFDALNLDIPWAAESRIGVSGSGDHELNIHDHTNSAQNRVQAEYEWNNGQAVDFSLAFDSLLNS